MDCAGYDDVKICCEGVEKRNNLLCAFAVQTFIRLRMRKENETLLLKDELPRFKSTGSRLIE